MLLSPAMENNQNINTESFTIIESQSSFLLSFEGIEGCGKTTQIKSFKEYLESNGYQVIVLREPGGTEFGENLRKSILTSQTPLAPIAEAYLFASSRAQLLTEKILPFLKSPKHVIILDRYIDSSIAYQGYARGLGMEQILKIHTPTPLNILPNLTFYLSISVEVSMQRQEIRNNKKDYFEQENIDFYQKLINGYEACAQVFPNRIKRIDATKDIENVNQQIKKAFIEHV
jgi:dTMP kinase